MSANEQDGCGCPGVKEVLLLQLQTKPCKSQAQRRRERGWEESRVPANSSRTVLRNSRQKPNIVKGERAKLLSRLFNSRRVEKTSADLCFTPQ